MNHQYKYDAFVVDPDLNSRMRLKQATIAVSTFGAVHLVGTLNEALAKMQNSGHCDVVFVSHRFDRAEVTSFIKKCKETKCGQDSAYVLVLQSNSGESAAIAQSVLGGADGMLFEPYSVDYLNEITDLASRVRKERTDAREKVAIGMLLQDIMSQVDQIAYLKSCSMDPSRAYKKLQETCTVLQNLSPCSGESYYQIAVDAFENAKMPSNISKYKKYGGVSDRIKKRMEKKVSAELEAKTTVPEKKDA